MGKAVDVDLERASVEIGVVVSADRFVCFISAGEENGRIGSVLVRLDLGLDDLSDGAKNC